MSVCVQFLPCCSMFTARGYRAVELLGFVAQFRFVKPVPRNFDPYKTKVQVLMRRPFLAILRRLPSCGEGLAEGHVAD